MTAEAAVNACIRGTSFVLLRMHYWSVQLGRPVKRTRYICRINSSEVSYDAFMAAIREAKQAQRQEA